MKFLVIKDLSNPGRPTASWVKYHKNMLEEKPEALRAEYTKLVKAIGTLHTIETTLRNEVFGFGEDGLVPSNPFTGPAMKSVNSVGEFWDSIKLMQRVSPLIDLFLGKMTDQLLKKV